MQELTDLLRGRGADLVGFADLSAVPAGDRQGLPRGVSLALGLDRHIIASIYGGPTREYCHEYERANRFLSDLAEEAAGFLREKGHQAVSLPATQDGLTADKLHTPLPHKTLATRAGLGWIGKCALLVTEPFGSAVRFASVLTDAPLPVGRPTDESRCGECTQCVQICPGRAPQGRNWKAGMKREALLDAQACFGAILKHRSQRGIPNAVCGMCVAACPWTRAYLARGKPARE